MRFKSLILAALVVAACSPQAPEGPAEKPDTSTDPTPQTVEVSSVTLSKTTLALATGDSEQLTATVFPPNADNAAVTWSSENPQVASVKDGLVSAVAVGETRVTASAGGKSAVCKVTVTKKIILVEEVAVEPDHVTLEEGSQQALHAVVLPEDADDRSVTWEVADPAIAKITGEGFDVTLEALSPGETSVTLTSGGISASCAVTVTRKPIPVESITLSETSLTLTEEDSAELTATVLPANADDPSVTWEVEGREVLSWTVDGNKLTITAMAAGTATVTATAGEKSATCTVTVNALARDADFVQKVWYLYPGAQASLTAQYSDGRPASPSDWQVAEGDWLTVDGSGNVSLTGFSSNPGRVSASVEGQVIKATFWSDVRVLADGSTVLPAEVGPFTIKEDGSVSLTFSYLSGPETWSPLPEGCLDEVQSDDTGVATVSATASSISVTPKGQGVAGISFKLGPAPVSFTVTVLGTIPTDGTITYPEDDYGKL